MTEQVAQHYGRVVCWTGYSALAQAGKDIDDFTIDDLAPVDEFHSRRRLATQELAGMMALAAGDHVTDIGSGLGGPSRDLAATYARRVSGVDLTPEFVEPPLALTACVSRPTVRVSALVPHWACRSGRQLHLRRAPDVAMTLPTGRATTPICIASCVPAGRLAIEDVPMGNGEALDFPAMWADQPEISLLRTP